MKRILSALLVLAMVLTVMPLAAFADDGNPLTWLYVGNVNALETPQGEGWSFDAQTGVLTLENCTLTGSSTSPESYHRYDGMIYAEGDLIIELVGDNYIERVIDTDAPRYTSYGAIFLNYGSKLTLRGTGSLTAGTSITAEAFDGSSNFDKCYGIYSSGLDLTGLSADSVVNTYCGVVGIDRVDYGKMNASYSIPTVNEGVAVQYFNMYGEAQTEESGYTHTMVVGNTGAYVTDQRELFVVDADIPANGQGWSWDQGVLTLSEGFNQNALVFGDAISEAKVVLTSNATLNASRYWGGALYAPCDLEIDAGDYMLSLISNEATALYVDGDLTVSGGQVYAQCKDTYYNDVWATGDLLVTDGSLIGRGGGLAASGSFVAQNAVVSATGVYPAIYAYSISFTDSTVIANAWEMDTPAILSDTTISVDNCEMTVYGGPGAMAAGANTQGQTPSAELFTFTDVVVNYGDEYYYSTYEFDIMGDTYTALGFVESYGDAMYDLSVSPAQEEEREGHVWELYVGGVNALENPVGDGWSFDADTGVLTLNNCTLTGTHFDFSDTDNVEAMIYFKGNLAIELIGENSVELFVEDEPFYYTRFYAIYASWYPGGDSALSIVGDGSLTAGVAITADAYDEETEELWEYLNFSCGIGGGYADLTGLGQDGHLDIYGGVVGMEAPYVTRAFSSYPIYTESTMIVAYRDLECTLENEMGYNWNNNDGWRMLISNDGALAGSSGVLRIQSYIPSSGEGWSWADGVLTLNSGDTLKAVKFSEAIDTAKIVLEGDVTLDATGLYDISGVDAYGDLEIDLNGHTLTAIGGDGWAGGVYSVEDMLIYDGSLNATSGPDGAMGDIYCYGNLTFRNVTVGDVYASISCDSTLTIENSSVTAYMQDYGCLNAYDIIIRNSTVYAENPESYAIECDNTLVIENSNVTVIGSEKAIAVRRWYNITPNPGDITITDCTITTPAGGTVAGIEEEPDGWGDIFTYVTVVDPQGVPAETVIITASSGHTHEHDSYGSDGENHWSVCSCGQTLENTTAEHSYTEGVCVCGKKQTFTVTWANWDGTILETDIVEYGVTPEYNGETPVRPNVGYDFTFCGWTKNTSNSQVTPGPATENITYTAFYTSTAHKWDIVFMDGQTELARWELYYSKYVSASASTLNGQAGHPTKACYTLTGWAYADGTLVTSSFYMPDEDVILYAVWEGPSHSWVDATCTDAKYCPVCGTIEGEALEHNWQLSGYTVEDGTHIANYICANDPAHTKSDEAESHSYTQGVCVCQKVQTFTITWKNWDGTVLETDIVEYGVTPEYNGETPTRYVVGQTCTFVGFRNVIPATADATYTASFTQVVNSYDLILMDGETELGRKEIKYGDIVSEIYFEEYAGYPSKACYAISGWQYADGRTYSSTRMPAEDMVLYVVWEGPSHSWVDATCTDAKYCPVCGTIEGEALGHSYEGNVCTVCGHTVDLPNPEKIEGLKVTATDVSSFTVAWDEANNVVKYWVYVNGIPYISTTDTFVTVTGRLEATDYTVAVTALLKDGTILSYEDADKVEVATDSFTYGLTCDATADSVTLNWTDNGAQKVWIYLGTDESNLKLMASSTGNSYTVGNLISNTQYLVKLAFLVDGKIVTMETAVSVATEAIDALFITRQASTVSWNAIGDSYKYWIYVNGQIMYSTTDTSFTFEGWDEELLANAVITVRGINADGIYDYYPA